MDRSVLPTDEDVNFFQKNGYWIAPKIIADKRLEQIRERMMWIYEGKFETGRPPQGKYHYPPEQGNRLRKTDNVHWADPIFRELVTDRTIGEIAARLMQAECIRLWHDQLLHKPGNSKESGNVGWHQDYAYWQCAAEPTLLTAWVAFDDVNLDNGCMQVVPGSNHWGLLNKGNFFDQNIETQEQELKNLKNRDFTKAPLIMKAGQVSFHHALTYHGSGPNLTDKPRRSIAIHMMTGTTRYRAGYKHHNVVLLNGQDGDLFANEYFPVLYDKKGDIR